MCQVCRRPVTSCLPGRQVPGSVITRLHVVALAEPGKVGDTAGQWRDIHRMLTKLVLYYQYHDRSDCTL